MSATLYFSEGYVFDSNAIDAPNRESYFTCHDQALELALKVSESWKSTSKGRLNVFGESRPKHSKHSSWDEFQSSPRTISSPIQCLSKTSPPTREWPRRLGTSLALSLRMNKSHYFLSPVLVYDGSDLKLALHRALISRRGVYKVFEESEQLRKTFLEARVFKAKIDGTDFDARLVRESGPAGTHYNLNLINASQDERLDGLLSRFGFESPWKRDFARIPASSVFVQSEVPVGAMLDRFSGTASVEVRNFSYHGLFLELQCACPSLGETVGQRITFRLVTSKGKVLGETTGRVARIYDEMVAPGLLKRGLGIRLLEMPESARRIYYGMILDACRELRGNF